MPPATPCASRAATICPGVDAAPTSALVTTNNSSAIMNRRRLPNMSPSRPAGTSASPKVSA
jgi:hypothetical protein